MRRSDRTDAYPIGLTDCWNRKPSNVRPQTVPRTARDISARPSRVRFTGVSNGGQPAVAAWESSGDQAEQASGRDRDLRIGQAGRRPMGF
jgi:hypothetical protein